MLWRLGLAFAGGALIAAATPVLPGLWMLALFAAVSLLLLYWPGWRWLAALGLGAAWFLLHAHWQLDQQWPEARAGETAQVAGTVSGLPELRGQTLRFELRPLPGQAPDLPDRIEVSWFRARAYLQPGEVHEFTLRLLPPHGRLNPGGPDRYRHLLSQRVGASGSVVTHHGRIEPGGFRGQVDRRRQYLAERLQAETMRRDTAALFRALGLADRAAMRPELSDLLRRTGTAHLLAISGLHVGMVAALFGLLGGLILGPLLATLTALDRRRVGVICGLLAALAYAALAGWTLPTVRALIMLVVAGVALSLRRGIRPQHALLLALLVVLLLDPLAPLAVGFWLSFGAVAVLIWAFAWRPGRPRGGWLGSLIVAQLVLAVGLLPLNVGIFQQMIPAALPANLFAIPLVGFWVLPLLLMSIGAMLLGLPAELPLGLAALGVDWLLWGLKQIDQIGWGYQRVRSGGLLAMILAGIGALWLIAPPGWPARWLGLPLLLPLLMPPAQVAPGDGLRLRLLDVGDGQLVVLQAGDAFLLYDSGPGDGEGRDSLSRLLPAVWLGQADPRLIGLILGRSHRGHSGGLGSARDWVPGDRIRVPPGFDGPPCQAGERWALGPYEVEFLHPASTLPPLGENSGCVVQVRGPGGAVLLLAGVDAQVERRLLLEYPQLRADVLVLAAGGHRRGGSSELLSAVEASWALASAARFDRFERPHAELQRRLDRAGVKLLTTGRCGAMTVVLEPDQEPRVWTERGRRRGFWLPDADCP
ncbi:MAG: DNA internalization-related competence protein ComEC/Rec2 [Wenzhouxiangella sp.]